VESSALRVVVVEVVDVDPVEDVDALDAPLDELDELDEPLRPPPLLPSRAMALPARPIAVTATVVRTYFLNVDMVLLQIVK